MSSFDPVAAQQAATARMRADDAGRAFLYNRARSFGAIAYSPSIRRTGCSWEQTSVAEARRVALHWCSAADARIVVEGQLTYLALAVALDGRYGWAADSRSRRAERTALRYCEGPSPRIVVLLDTLRGLITLEDPPQKSKEQFAQEAREAHEAAYEIFLQRTGWGAIACSRATMRFSYSQNQDGAESAVREAIRNCNQPDAVALISGYDSYLAVVRCSGNFAGGRSNDPDKAEQLALAEGAQFGPSPEPLLLLHTRQGVIKPPQPPPRLTL